MENSIDLLSVMASLGIENNCVFPPLYDYELGILPDDYMIRLFQTSDVHMQCTLAEGFGIPAIEAQACGTPVIGTRCSAITELVPAEAGWLVNGEPYWNINQRSWWTWPSADQIEQRLIRAHSSASSMRKGARKNALNYDQKLIGKEIWPEVMKEIENRCL